MKIVLIITAIMFAFIGVGAIVTIKLIKKVDPQGSDKTEGAQIKTTQEFLPFEDIRDDVIFLGSHRYRAVLSCNSTNYRLKTAGEKEQIELSFQRFLNTITFPITFFLQTKVIDNTVRLSQMESEISETLTSFPNMTGYAEQYLADMRSLHDKLGNNQQKRRYIIISYDNADELNKLSDAEKDDYAVKEVRRRAQMVQGNLDAVGVSSHIMSTQELIELVYSTYSRDDYSYASELNDGGCFSLFVDGEEDAFKDMPKAELLDLIFGEAINKLELENITRDAAGKQLLGDLESLRNRYAGYFKNQSGGALR